MREPVQLNFLHVFEIASEKKKSVRGCEDLSNEVKYLIFFFLHLLLSFHYQTPRLILILV